MSARLLLVEDNDAYVENLKEIFTDLGHEVRTVGSCAAAREAARDWVQVALVDLKLPDGDGTSLARELKEENPDSEVILLTGHASMESAAASVRAGVWAYLMKPCAVPDLLATLDKAVRHVEAQQEKRELARRAQVAEKLATVGTLTAGLSHEIRNPLNAAALQLSVLERRVRKLEPGVQGPLLDPLTLVRDEIRRLEHILQDFLQFARPLHLTIRQVDLRLVLEKVLAFISTDAERRRVHLTASIGHPALIAGDADQLRQVFMNLLLNAFDAAPEQGEVRLTTETDGDVVEVHVDDSGPGVPSEQLQRIFEPFFTTKSKGSGLGLPITHAIVSQHGGTLTVSRGPLGGARFTVSLPRAKSPQ
ncbi:MAG: response regulator [Myxococcaceae bacterium]|nr:response regulator [Myxococcaceae bacterium]